MGLVTDTFAYCMDFLIFLRVLSEKPWVRLLYSATLRLHFAGKDRLQLRSVSAISKQKKCHNTSGAGQRLEFFSELHSAYAYHRLNRIGARDGGTAGTKRQALWQRWWLRSMHGCRRKKVPATRIN
jgi:hypothetical protein